MGNGCSTTVKRDAISPVILKVTGGRIAQLVEQLTLNQRVPGSSPGAPTIA